MICCSDRCLICRGAATPAPPAQGGAHSQPCTGLQQRAQSDADVVWGMLPEELQSVIAKRLAAAGGSQSMVC